MSENGFNNHLAIGELPILQVVAIDDLLFHEEPDRGRLIGLVNRFGTEGVLKNPPIVATIGNGRFAILDGANRVTALTKLGFKHVAVQVVDLFDPLLSVYCWNHEIEKLDRVFFTEKILSMPGLDLIEDTPEEVLWNGEPTCANGDCFLCHFTWDNGHIASVTSSGDIMEQVSQLCEITDLYLETQLYDRVSYANVAHLKKHYPEFRTLITFRCFAKEEFLQIVSNGAKLPAGVTRVFLPKRALGLNIPLEFLKSELSLAEQNQWLDEMILKKVREKSIRFYREPTFAFDE